MEGRAVGKLKGEGEGRREEKIGDEGTAKEEERVQGALFMRAECVRTQLPY
jgi:hypothetical protein